MQVPAVRVQACLDVAEALAPGQLRESKRVEVTSAAEIANPLISAIPGNNVPE
jgi:hypothetical protein